MLLATRPASFDAFCAWARDTPSDINVHWGALCCLAREVSHVTEFGVRHGVSTSAFLSAAPVALVSYDVVVQREVGWLQDWALERGAAFEFHHADVLEVVIAPTEMLFIDTLHVYAQLARELALHADNVARWIVLHDTEVPPDVGNEKEGMWAAVGEFLIKQSGRWQVRSHDPASYGLTVLERQW